MNSGTRKRGNRLGLSVEATMRQFLPSNKSMGMGHSNISSKLIIACKVPSNGGMFHPDYIYIYIYIYNFLINTLNSKCMGALHVHMTGGSSKGGRMHGLTPHSFFALSISISLSFMRRVYLINLGVQKFYPCVLF